MSLRRVSTQTMPHVVSGFRASAMLPVAGVLMQPLCSLSTPASPETAEIGCFAETRRYVTAGHVAV